MSTTFFQLVQKYGRVEIPIIQRDYAQGRTDQHIVRSEFLNVLYEALNRPSDDRGIPLDLDFVYGDVIAGSFQPLDGQQRLTTLFLLHWYLAWVDRRSSEFQSHFVDGDKSRFVYEVRPSSREFVDRLANYVPAIDVGQCADVRSMVTDQPWYFRNWRLDPTIRSALQMLEQMHMLFRNTSGFYDRLVDKLAPAVTFQLLQLENFGLSDDLYIKMNARGKPLTAFEAFKARLKQLLQDEFEDLRLNICGNKETTLADFFADRIDTRWSDFFWPFRDVKSNTFDSAVMNLVRGVIMVTRPVDADSVVNDLDDLRRDENLNSYSWFRERNWLDQELIKALFTLLERWSDRGTGFRCYLPNHQYVDEEALFRDVISRPENLRFQQLVVFYGYVQYLVNTHDEIDPANFNNWMRLVLNLATNTDYNRPDDLRRSFAGLRALSPRMDDILVYLAEDEADVAGFDRQQVAEERIKALLLRYGKDWTDRIHTAEQHRYFDGQIGFLLCFCGVDLNSPQLELRRLSEEAAADLSGMFDRYFEIAQTMFDDILLDASDSRRLWERALLATGDYLLTIGNNRSLLQPTRDDPWSWKRLLKIAGIGDPKGVVLKQLWDKLEMSSNLNQDLREVIGSRDPNIEAWRDAIISTPAIYDYGKNRMMRFGKFEHVDGEDRIYVLSKTQLNGWHAELFTYCLYISLESEVDPPKLSALELEYVHQNSTEEFPCLFLYGKFNRRKVTFCLCLSEHSNDVFELYLYEPQRPRNDEFCKFLVAQGFKQSEGWWSSFMDKSQLSETVISLDVAFAE